MGGVRVPAALRRQVEPRNSRVTQQGNVTPTCEGTKRRTRQEPSLPLTRSLRTWFTTMRRMASHASPPSAVQKSRSDTSQSKGSDFISSSSMNDNNVLAELVEELIEYTLFKNPLEILLAEEGTTRDKSLIEIDKGDRSEDTPWIQLTNIVCQNIIVWITVMGATLSIMMMLLFLLNSYIRKWQPL